MRYVISNDICSLRAWYIMFLILYGYFDMNSLLYMIIYMYIYVGLGVFTLIHAISICWNMCSILY